MLFNSYEFVIFFASVFSLYWLLKPRAQNTLLLVASYFFYGSWDWRFLSLIVVSTIVDFYCGLKLGICERDQQRRLLLWASVFTNLGILAFFKYSNFFAGEFFTLLNALGVSVSAQTLNIVLPVGISFYTFQTMSYTIDVYRKKQAPCESFPDFALYVCFFPQLVAGPIERYSRLMPQIRQPRHYSLDLVSEGTYHLLVGFFKKMVIADNLGRVANAVFSTEVGSLTGPECTLGVVAFAFQIYGDFSGYSSIAQGTAKLLGFDLIYNFRQPYFAKSPSEFWQRWHISLSTWLRDYLYIPLGGNRSGGLLTYRNLLLTMLLGGLWHGAGWTFILWGLFHGVILILFRLGAQTGMDRFANKLPVVLQVLLMFVLTLVGWLLFRAESGMQAVELLSRILTNLRVTETCQYMAALILFFATPLVIFEFVTVQQDDDMLWIFRRHWVWRALLYNYIVFSILLFAAPQSYEFIYFQF